jgi:hypothetical protein
MAILAMPEHGQDARGTRSSPAAKIRGLEIQRKTGEFSAPQAVRADGRADSPPDSELVLNAMKEGAGAVSDGGGYDIQEGRRFSAGGWLRAEALPTEQSYDHNDEAAVKRRAAEATTSVKRKYGVSPVSPRFGDAFTIWTGCWLPSGRFGGTLSVGPEPIMEIPA